MPLFPLVVHLEARAPWISKSKMGENLKIEESEVEIAIETEIGGTEVTGMETGGLVEGGKTEMTGGKGVTEEEMVIGVGMIEEDHQDLEEMMIEETEEIQGGEEMTIEETEMVGIGAGGMEEEMKGMEERM